MVQAEDAYGPGSSACSKLVIGLIALVSAYLAAGDAALLLPALICGSYMLRVCPAVLVGLRNAGRLMGWLDNCCCCRGGEEAKSCPLACCVAAILVVGGAVMTHVTQSGWGPECGCCLPT